MHSNTHKQQYFLLIYCLHIVSASNAPRLPMEVFGVNSTQVTNTTSMEDRKMMMALRHKLLLNSYGSTSGVATAAAATPAAATSTMASTSSTVGGPVTTTTGGMMSLVEQRKGRQIDEGHSARILYQVGNSESDLPICAPNAVCSKIDLYESPWIERQCRCPKSSAPIKHSHITVNHPKDLKPANVHDSYHQFLEEQKMKLSNMDGGGVDAADNYDGEDQHLKLLLRKLGVFYKEDDIVLNENDYTADYHIANTGIHKSHPYRKSYSDWHDTKKLRHSIHRMDMQRLGGCPNTITTDDGHTIADKTRYYKLCEPIHKLPQCRYFKDWVWTLKTSPEMNVTEQIVHCRCPKNAVTYLIRREPLQTGTIGYTYLFACSPQSRLRCQRKEPCKLFTVRKRQEFLDEVNTNPLCSCPRNHHCPSHHMDSGVILGKSYIEDNIRTYSGYCMQDEKKPHKFASLSDDTK